MHLRAADASADLGLGEVLAEAQSQHEPVALRQCVQQLVEGCGGLGGLEAGVFVAESFSERRCVALLRRRGTVKGIARARVGRFGGVEELFERAADLCGELARGRVRPRSLVSCSRARSIRIARSCSSRGGRTVQVKSRK